MPLLGKLTDLKGRATEIGDVAGAVGFGEAGEHYAAEHYDVNRSTAVIWVRCFRETGCCSAKRRGALRAAEQERPDVARTHHVRGGVASAWPCERRGHLTAQ